MPSAYAEHTVIEQNEVGACRLALHMPRRIALMEIETSARASMKGGYVQKRQSRPAKYVDPVSVIRLSAKYTTMSPKEDGAGGGLLTAASIAICLICIKWHTRIVMNTAV